MLEVGISESKTSALESAFEYSLVNPIKEVNHLVCNFIQGEWSDLSLAISNEEAIEVHHLLVEPHFSETFEDDAVPLNSINLENCVTVRGTQHNAGNYDQGNDTGILDANTELSRQASKYDFMLEGTEEVDDLHTSCNLACDCSDYLLETFSTENSVDCSLNSQPTVINLESACQIQGVEDEVISEFPSIAKPFSITTMNYTNVAHDPSHDPQHISIYPYKYIDAEEILFDQQNSSGLGSIYDFFLSRGKEDDIIIAGDEIAESVFSSLVSMPHAQDLAFCAVKNEFISSNSLAVLRQGNHEIPETANVSIAPSKRLRKPTRRYIEETPEMKHSCLYDQRKLSLISSKDKLLHEKTEVKYHRSGAVQLHYQDYLSMHRNSRGYRSKSTKQLEYHGKGNKSPSEYSKVLSSTFTDYELQDDASSDASSVITRQRRKHHRKWTVSEAIKLVDGVSQYGFGRWTVIKKQLFSTSAYRTAVDLKDKWRNLLRACAADAENRSLVDRRKNHASGPIPQFILQKVRELSVHPPISVTNRRGRILHRRGFS